MKKNFKRLFALMFAFLMVFSLCGMNYVQALPKTPATVNAAAYAKTYNLSVGKTVRLNATSRTTWETSDKTVATVSTAGVVRAMAPGTAVITAKSSRNTTQYQINVTAPVLSETSLSLSRGETHKLTVTSQATIGAISWSTSNKKVATVSSYGVVTAKGNGTAVITAKIDGFRYTCNVTVANKPVASYSEISSRALKNYTNMISAYLEDNDMELVEVVKASDVTVKNQNGPFTATLKNVDISKISEATKLFHIKGTSVEEVDFVLSGTNVEFTCDTFSPFILANVKAADDGGYVVVTPVENNTDCNFAFMEKTWFDEPDAFIKGLGSTLQGYMITYRDADGNVIVPDGPRTVTIENVDMDAFESEDEIVLAYTYIDPNVWDGNDNGVMYMNSVPYEYDAVNHTVTFEFNEFQPYYGNIMICQGGHRDLVVDEPHGPLTWSVNSNCPWGDVLVDQNGRVEVWGSFDNVEVTATDGNKTWIWLINGASNDIINLHPVVNVGETSYCYGYDDMRAGYYLTVDPGSPHSERYNNGAIVDNKDGTFTAVKPGTYTFIVGFKYFLGQEGFATQSGSITIIGEEQPSFTVNPLEGDALNKAVDAVNAYLANENKQIDTVKYAADITSNNSEPIRIEDIDIPEGAILYHVAEDGTVTEVPYTVEDGVLVFTSPEFSPFILATVKAVDNGYVDIRPVENVTDCNIAFMEKGWFEEPDAFIKGFGSTLNGYMLTYRDADGNVIVPDEPKTVVIENVDFSKFDTEDEIVLAYTYIDPNVWNGNANGVMYMDSVPYEYDPVNHTVTFEFDAFQPYYGNIEIAQGGHRDLVVDEPHGDLTWSVDNNCEWGDCLVDQNGRVEAWGSFDNIEVKATDGNKTWTWLINVCGNEIINRSVVVNVGEKFYCYGYDDMRAGSYISSEIREDGRIDYQNECGAIKDNGDGTATALKPGTYNLAIGFKYFLGQEGFSIQFGSITILGEEPAGFTATPLTDEQLAAAKEAVNAYLANENKQIDTVQYAADITPNGTNSIDIEGLSIPEGAVLYHVGEDGTVTPVEYTIVDGVLHFEFNDFSPFLLVTTKSNINESFLGKWYAQGTNILWEVTVYDDGTFFNHYPNYSVGDMTYTWKLADNGDTLVLFEDNFSFDENGNLVDKAWNAQGIHYAQRILSRIPNIMGWWRSADSFIEGETYPDGEHGIGFYLNEHDYCKEFNFDGEGNLEFINSDSADTYKYDVDTDTIVVTHDDGSQTILNRWYDDTLQ